MKTRIEINGDNFASLEEFYAEVSRKVIPEADWGRNLDAFNDILRGGFGTPEDGFVLVWKNHSVSRERLGYEETVHQLQLKLERCHPSNAELVARDLAAAQRHEGATVFDWLVAIIRDHGAGGQEAEDNVELVLA